MSFIVPNTEPSKVNQGDSIEWKKTIPNFSAADGYVLNYALRGPSKIDLTASASGGDFSLVVTAAASALWVPGNYYWQSFVTKTSQRWTVGSGQMLVVRNLAAVTDPNFDGRTPARRALDCIQATLRGTATRVQEEYEIDGVRIKDKSISELLTLEARFINLVAAEVSQDNIDNGRPGRKKILARFVKP